jgi:hypothetical protein
LKRPAAVKKKFHRPDTLGPLAITHVEAAAKNGERKNKGERNAKSTTGKSIPEEKPALFPQEQAAP